MDSNYTPPSAEPPFDPDKYTPPSAEPPKKMDEVMPPSSEPVIIDVNAKEAPTTPGFDAVPEGLAGEPPRAQTPPPPAKSNTARTIWIIVIVVLVVTAIVGECGGNILEVEHHRLVLDVPVKRTDIDVLIETRDRGHGVVIKERLAAAGFPVALGSDLGLHPE